jgi:AcrR family transcriptional regulator
MPGTARRRARKRVRLTAAERRRRLIEVGLDLFATRPYGEVSMDAVADAAGVAHGTVYHHFADKGAFYRAILEDVGRRLTAIADPDPYLPPREQLLAGLRAHVAFAAELPDVYRALVTGGNGADPELQSQVEEMRWRGLRPILASLGVSSPGPRVRLVLRGWSSFNEGVVLEWLRRRDLDEEEVAALLAEALAALLAQVAPERAGRDRPS